MAGLIISPRARIFQGHDWVYGTEVRKVFGNPQPGDVVALKDFKDRFLGSAMFNPHSQIVARRFSRRKQELDGDFFSRRISQALELRSRFLPGETLTRLVWSESDGLPGLIVDRYADYLVVQTLALAMERRLHIILNVLEDLLSPGESSSGTIPPCWRQKASNLPSAWPVVRSRSPLPRKAGISSS